MLREIERDGDRIVHMWDARAIVALVREADEAMVKAVESETSAALRYWQQGTHDVLDRPARASLLARLDDLRRDRDEAAAALGMSQEAMEVCVDCENAMRDRAEEAERAAAVE